MAETGETRPMSWENPRAYELSEVASETVAGHISEWSQIPFIGLRFSNILGPGHYQQFPERWLDAGARRRNLWGYIDERDAAMACRLALEAPAKDAASYIIAAADTVMDPPSAELLAEVYPGGTLTRGVGVRHPAGH
jgi:nucleoside-diphosphate-sugar epimerase